MRLAIVIPALNEADALPRTIEVAREGASSPLELVVSDCGSGDATREVASSLGATVATGGTCRADALNRGAAVATGDVLLFLHADTRLPSGWDHAVRRCLRDSRIVGGAFDFSFAGHPLARGLNRQGLRLVQTLNRGRFRITGSFYGDQAIFCRRDVFERIGGFDRIRLLEDARFSRRLGRLGRTAILQPPVKTSPRRFIERGVYRQLAINLAIVIRDLCGLHLDGHAGGYRSLNTAGHVVAAYPAPKVTPPAATAPAAR